VRNRRYGSTRRLQTSLGYCPWVSYATLGGRLRQVRMFQGLSAAALAAKLKAEEATVALWESDEAVPVAHHRLNLALFLGIRLDL
jgi:transcriptional regulator with XRE-family HTH domain